MTKTPNALTRVLSLLLIAAMLLGTVPAGVAAVETTALPEEEAQLALSVEDASDELTDEARLQLFSENMNTELVQDADLPDLDEEVRVIVELEVESLLDLRQEEKLQTLAMDEFLQTQQAQDLLLEIRQVQDSVTTQMQDAGIASELTYSYSAVTSGFAAKMTYGEMLEVEQMEGVRNVVLSELFYTDNVGQAQTLGQALSGAELAATANTTDYQGEGMLIGILDTGLDYTHEAFANAPEVQKLTRDHLNKIANYDVEYDADGKVSKVTAYSYAALWYAQANSKTDYVFLTADDLYVSGKVPFAFDYADGDADVMPTADSVEKYGNDHGTHVAGIAAGKTVDDAGNVTFAGQAPEAQLAIFKVFSDSSSGASTDTLLAALNDAILLGVDAINMSLGSGGGFATDTSEAVNTYYDAVKAYGILLNCSGGNAYSSAMGGAQGDFAATSDPDTGIASSPSSYDAALGVASVNTLETASFTVGGQKLSYNDVSGHDFAALLLGEADSSDFEYVMVPGYGEPGDYEGLDVSGKLAVVIRGSLSFNDKQLNAAAAGAIGCIIYNNRSGYPLNMQIDDYTIPTVSVTDAVGAALAQQENMVLTLSREASIVEMSDFSSWGPTPGLELKPEITAPGGDVYSSLPFGQYGVMSGTSMASPYVAGSSVAVMQYVKKVFPGASTEEKRALVNQLMMSTADILYDASGVAYSPRKQGAGLVNVEAAVTTPAYLYVKGTDKTKLSLGDDPYRNGIYDLPFQVKNFSGNTVSYTINTTVQTETVSADGQYIMQEGYPLNAETQIEVSGGVLEGNVLTLAPGHEASVVVTLVLDSESTGYMDDNFENGIYVEGFVELSSQENPNLSIPYLAFYGDWSEAPILEDADYFNGEDVKLYQTTAAGVYGLMYTFPLGTFVFTTPEGYTAPAPSADRMSLDLGSGNGMSNLYYLMAGQLRGAATTEMVIRDADTDDEVYSYTGTGTRKAYYNNGSIRPGYMGTVWPELMSYGTNIPSGTRLNYTITATVDTDGAQRNQNDSYSFDFTSDSEMPWVVNRNDLKFYYGDDGRVYLDVVMADNFALAGATLYSARWGYNMSGQMVMSTGSNYYDGIFPAVKENGDAPGAYEEYTYTFDVTDFYKELTDGTFYLVAYDYALNQCCLKVILDEIPVTEINLDTTEATLPIRGFVQLNATVNPDNATNQALVWTSSDSSVAEVRSGLVKALATGTTTITVTAKAYPEVSASYVVTVTEEVGPDVPMEAFTLNRTGLSIEVGDVNTATRLYAYTPYTATNLEVTWSSSDESVATVDENGAITGVAAGTAVVTAKAVLGDASASVNVTVKDSAAGSEGGTGSFSINGDVLISYSGTEATVTVPDGIRVIGDEAFKSNTSVVNVVLPDSVEEICYRAFYGCSNLQSVNLPETMTALGKQAFYNCKKLASFGLEDKGLIPAGLTEIPEGCFYNCNALAGALVVPEGVTTICTQAFYGLQSITSLTLPTTLNSWSNGNAQFSGCSSLTQINLPETLTTLPRNCFFGAKALTALPDLKNVTEIGQSCFQGCTALVNVTIPATIQVMGANVFYGCTALTSVHFEGDPEMGKTVFQNCKALTSVTGNFTTIPEKMFQDCDAMVTFTIPDGVTSIGKQAFYGCDLLESVIFPATYNAATLSIGEAPFYNCKKCSGFTVAEGCTALKFVDGVLYSGDGKQLILLPGDFAETTFVVPEGVEVIADYAFNGKTKLQSITFPSTLKSIGAYAFQKCSALTAIDLPDGVTTVGANAFSNCSAVKTLNLGKSLTAVPDNAFYELKNVTSIVLPDTVQSVGDRAFYNCNAATTIELPEGLVSIGVNAFYACKKAMEIILPSTLTELGTYAFYNCNAAKTIDCGNLTQIPQYAFSGCTAATTITLSDNVTTIGSYAFNNCNAVTHIDWPSKLETLEKYAFYACRVLDSLDLSGTKVKTIGNYAFYQPYLVEELVLPETLESIGSKAFAYMNYNKTAHVTTVHLPASVTTVASDAFYYCTKLQSITVDEANPVYTASNGILIVKETGELYIWPTANTTTEFTVPGNMTRIPAKMFQDNRSLRKVIIHSGVEYIGTYAFSGSNIEEFVFEPSAAGLQIDSYAFSNCDGIEKIELPYGTLALNSSVFAGCDSLVSAELPDTIVSMGGSTFSRCTALKDVHLPAGVSTLPSMTFYGCSSLEELTLPAGVTDCGVNQTSTPWSQCYSLKNIWVEDGSKSFKSVDGVLYDITGKTLWVYPAGRTAESLIIPEGTIRVAQRAALGNEYLKSVSFPGTMARIGDMAFYMCSNLKDFYFNGMQAPILETSLSASSLAYASYWNFVDAWMEVDSTTYKVTPNNLGLNLYYPEGASGFDAYVWEIYFYSGSTNVMDASYFTVTDLTAQEAEGRTVQLSWTAAKQSAAEDLVYTVERAEAVHIETETQNTWSYGTFEQLAQDLTGTEFVDVTALHFGMSYVYRVSAYNADGETGPAALATVTIAVDESDPDEMAALAVIRAIEALAPVENLTLDDEAEVVAVQAMYDALTDAQKALVPNLATLDAAKAWIDSLYAMAVQQLIEALPEPDAVVAADADRIAQARKAYDALTDAQKALVPNLEKLTACEAALQLALSVQQVEQMIAALPRAENIQLDDAQAVAAARAAYEALAQAQQELVGRIYLDKLEDCEKALARFQEITDVEALIEALPAVDLISEDDAEAIQAARAAYEALTPEQQAEVANYDKLVAAEEALKALDQLSFTDVQDENWFYPYVKAITKKGLVNGYTDSTFRPFGNLTRAEMVTLLYRAAGSPEVSGKSSFTDIPADAWYCPAVTWAERKGIANGIGNNQFGPDDSVSREQLVTMLWRLAGEPESNENLNAYGFQDVEKINTWAKTAMQWAVSQKMINGTTLVGATGIYLAPQNSATRAEAAKILCVYLEIE